MYKGTPQATEITRRFFLVLDILRQNKEIRGLATIAKRYDLNYWNLSTLRNDPDGRILRVELIANIVRDYKVSADWILLGVGDMFKK